MPRPSPAAAESRALAPRSSTCALTAEGAAYCWGENERGHLGAATTAVCGDSGTNTVIRPCSTTPLAVNTALRFTSLALGWDHTCGLTADGEAYCWGSNSSGQLGTGDTVARAAPARVVAVR